MVLNSQGPLSASAPTRFSLSLNQKTIKYTPKKKTDCLDDFFGSFKKPFFSVVIGVQFHKKAKQILNKKYKSQITKHCGHPVKNTNHLGHYHYPPTSTFTFPGWIGRWPQKNSARNFLEVVVNQWLQGGPLRSFWMGLWGPYAMYRAIYNGFNPSCPTSYEFDSQGIRSPTQRFVWDMFDYNMNHYFSIYPAKLPWNPSRFGSDDSPFPLGDFFCEPRDHARGVTNTTNNPRIKLQKKYKTLIPPPPPTSPHIPPA